LTIPGKRAAFAEIDVGDETGFFEDIPVRTPTRYPARATPARGAPGRGLPARRLPQRPRAAPGLLGFSIFVGAIVVIAPVPVAVAVLPSSPLRAGPGGLSPRARSAHRPRPPQGGRGGAGPQGRSKSPKRPFKRRRPRDWARGCRVRHGPSRTRRLSGALNHFLAGSKGGARSGFRRRGQRRRKWTSKKASSTHSGK
jgi:hypothetical protein